MSDQYVGTFRFVYTGEDGRAHWVQLPVSIQWLQQQVCDRERSRFFSPPRPRASQANRGPRSQTHNAKERSALVARVRRAYEYLGSEPSFPAAEHVASLGEELMCPERVGLPVETRLWMLSQPRQPPSRAVPSSH